MENKFTIDFFEFSFLVEACIPPRPIARTVFWNNVIDRYYYQMTVDERKELLKWIELNPYFLPEKVDGCAIFKARFNPDNQYIVYSNVNGVEEKHETFLYKDKYHTGVNTWINERFITKIEQVVE